MHAAIYDGVNAIVRPHKPYSFASRRSIEFPLLRTLRPMRANAHAVLGTLIIAEFPNDLDRNSNSLLGKFRWTDRRKAAVLGQTVADRNFGLCEATTVGYCADSFHFGNRPRRLPVDATELPQAASIHALVSRHSLAEIANPISSGPASCAGQRIPTAMFSMSQSLGIAGSTTASDKALTGRFWMEEPFRLLEQIAQNGGPWRRILRQPNARLFALLNLTFADSVIAFTTLSTRTTSAGATVTATRGCTDGNPKTLPDPNWLRRLATHPDPAYPGAHAVLRDWSFGLDVFSSEGLMRLHRYF